MLELIYAVFVFVLSNTKTDIMMSQRVELGDKTSWVLYQ